MNPNFYDKEYILTNLIILRFKEPIAGDVVVFKAPPEPEKDYIKIVIGVPGNTVSIQDSQVYVNGKLFDESKYLSSSVKTFPGAFLREGDTVTVPDEQYFVMGDNRNASSDSREWGFVKKQDIIGESLFVYLPVNKMRFVENPLTTP